MNCISLFAGIEGFGLALKRAGHTVVAMVEKDKACRGVLRRRLPGVPLFDDVTTFGEKDLPNVTVDLVCGGFPCQDLSVAGKRAGLSGKRSGLWFEFVRVIGEFAPQWVIVENVPGLLSSCGCAACGAVRRILRIHRYLRRKRQIHQPCAICVAGKRMLESHRGRDFAILIQGLEERGYDCAWRILDAQYFGVAQRRRRVFVVASARDARRPMGKAHVQDGAGLLAMASEILFESEGVRRDAPPRRPSRESDAGAIGARIARSHTELDGHGAYVYQFASGGGDDLKDTAQALRAGAEHNYQVVYDARGNGDGETAPTLTGDHANRIGDYTPVVVMQDSQAHVPASGDVVPALNAMHEQPIVATRSTVRRLTPVECERLMGLPDGWTEYGMKPDGTEYQQADTHRYRQLGNAVVVPTVEWIARRLPA